MLSITQIKLCDLRAANRTSESERSFGCILPLNDEKHAIPEAGRQIPESTKISPFSKFLCWMLPPFHQVVINDIGFMAQPLH